jgi:hypothetical protein
VAPATASAVNSSTERPRSSVLYVAASMPMSIWEGPRSRAASACRKGSVSVTESSSPAICRANRWVLRMLTTDLFTKERLCRRTVTSRSRCSFPMMGIIDSAISSRVFQLVNESSLTVTGLSFELDGAHMLNLRRFDHAPGAV